MNNSVGAYQASLSINFSLDPQSAAGGLPARTQQAAGALGSYMHENGVDTMDPNKLYKLAQNSSGDVPPTVSDAAKFMLQNPDVYAKLETHDVAGRDGISGVANFDFAARGGLATGAQNMGQGAVQSGSSGLSEGAAAGTLGAYMHENGMKNLDPNKLYALAMRPGADTPPGVSAAARFMLQNPDAYKKIETNDVAGADGISGVRNFDAAAQGKVAGLNTANVAPFSSPAGAPASSALGSGFEAAAVAGAMSYAMEMLQALQMGQSMLQGRSMDAQNAAGTLAAFMHENGIKNLTPGKLYKLAENSSGKVPQAVSDAAKFMLQNPDAYKKIETNDVAGADGISGVRNFDAAAQGKVAGLNTGNVAPFSSPAGGPASSALGSGFEAAAAAVAGAMSYAMEMLQALQMGQSMLQGRSMDAQNAAGTLAGFMHENGIKNLTPGKLYKLAENSSGKVPQAVSDAAKFMLQNPDAYKKIETNDVAGADGISGVRNFDAAAQGKVAGLNTGNVAPFSSPAGGPASSALGSGFEAAAVAGAMSYAMEMLQALQMGQSMLQGRSMDAQNAAGTLAAFMHENGIKNLTPGKLYKLAENSSGKVPQAVSDAAKFMLQNPDAYKKIETNDVAGADGISGVRNFDAAAQGKVAGLKTAGAPATPSGARAGEIPPATGNVLVNEPIVVKAGETFDGGGKHFQAGPKLGDGGQGEDQKPVFILEDGAKLKNVQISGADGVHTKGDATLQNVWWKDVGEDAMTMKGEGNVHVMGGGAYNASDKIFQVNAGGSLTIEGFTADTFGKAVRTNGGKDFPVDITIRDSVFRNGEEAVVRSDASQARITLERVQAADIQNDVLATTAAQVFGAQSFGRKAYTG